MPSNKLAIQKIMCKITATILVNVYEKRFSSRGGGRFKCTALFPNTLYVYRNCIKLGGGGVGEAKPRSYAPINCPYSGLYHIELYWKLARTMFLSTYK